MRIIISVLVFSVLLSGCINGYFHKKSINSPTCGNVSGYTYTLVAYGNGTVAVIPLSRIEPNTEWRFYLYPVEKLGGAAAYGAKTVTIDGKALGAPVLNGGATTLTGYVMPPIPGHDTWLSASGDFNNNATGTGRKRYITACVDPAVVTGQEYHYVVKVEDVGEVDPRGKVE